MVQGTYEVAMVKLRSLGVMRADLQQRFDDIQAQEWSRDGRAAQILRQHLRDIDAESADAHRVVAAARACQ